MRGIMSVFHKVSLRTRILSIVAMACLLCAVISIGGLIHFNDLERERGILSKERTIQTQLLAATDFVAQQGGLNSVIEKYSTKYKSADQISETERKEIMNQVPIFSALMIGKKNASLDHYTFRVFSDEPRNKDNLATAQELEIFKKFEADSSLQEQIVKEGQLITLFRPVRINESQGCLSCHGSPSMSPWKNGADILGHKMEGWKDGKLHGVFAITQNIDEVKAAASTTSTFSPVTLLILAILAGALISILIAAWLASAPIKTISDVVKSLSSISLRVNGVSLNVASSAQELSQASTEQAASLEQTSAALEEISAMIDKSAANADSTASSSTESQTKAIEGRNAVEQMLTSIQEISQSNEAIMGQIRDSNQQMAGIVTVIEGIGSKTKVINEIVFQTKLLSFNASVEAARAGENGKGFAVVAEEVGNLAQMSGNAAKEISEMLDASTHKVNTIVQETKTRVESLIEQGKQKVQAGAQVAKQCSDVLNDIVTNVTKVSDLSVEISQASREQAQGVGEINKAISQLDVATQQNAATSEETARAAEALATHVESLKSAVGDLVQTIEGESHDVKLESPPSSGMESRGKVESLENFKNHKKAPVQLKVLKASGQDLDSTRSEMTSTELGSVAKKSDLRSISSVDEIPSADNEGFGNE